MRTARHPQRKWRSWYIGLWVSSVFIGFAVVTLIQSAGFSSVPQQGLSSLAVQPSTGQISGLVLSNTGEPIAGLQIVIMRTDDENMWGRGIETDENGRFAVEHLEPGTYVVLPPERTLRRFAPGKYHLVINQSDTDHVEFRQEPAPPETYWQTTATHRAVWG